MYIKDYDGDEIEVTLGIETYVNNNQIAVLLYTPDWEYYSDLSVFVKPLEYQNYMAVDINNLPNAEEFIKKYELGEFVWRIDSWFVSYPVYAMNIKKLKEWSWNLDIEIEDNSDDTSFNIWDKLKQ